MYSIISDADLRAIEHVARNNASDAALIHRLRQQARIVEGPTLPENTVRLNSLVMLWHSFLKKVVKVRIVLPGNEDLGRRNLSVFAPLSMAILGRRESDRVHLRLAGIEKELRIIKVINK